MKKFFTLTLVLAALAGAACASAQEPAAGEFLGKELYGYVTFVTVESLLEPLDVPAGARLVFVQSPYVSRWLTIPDGGPGQEAYWGNGIRFTLDESSLGQGVSAADSIFALPPIITPASVEIIGGEVYGVIKEIGEGYLLVEAYGENALGEAGETVRLAYDGQTLAYKGDYPYEIRQGTIGDIFAPEDSCQLLYDHETKTVWIMWEAHG